MTPEYKALIRSRAEYQEDVDFVVNARRFVPDLLEYVEELEKNLEAIKKRHFTVHKTECFYLDTIPQMNAYDLESYREAVDRRNIMAIAEALESYGCVRHEVSEDIPGVEFRRVWVTSLRPIKEGVNDEQVRQNPR